MNFSVSANIENIFFASYFLINMASIYLFLKETLI